MLTQVGPHYIYRQVKGIWIVLNFYSNNVACHAIQKIVGEIRHWTKLKHLAMKKWPSIFANGKINSCTPTAKLQLQIIAVPEIALDRRHRQVQPVTQARFQRNPTTHRHRYHRPESDRTLWRSKSIPFSIKCMYVFVFASICCARWRKYLQCKSNSI